MHQASRTLSINVLLALFLTLGSQPKALVTSQVVIVCP